MPIPRIALVALALLCLGGLPGCVDVRAVVFGDVGWNETIKPALGRIFSDDLPVVLFSDGGPRGDEIVSEVDWSLASAGADDVYGYLPASRCLWVDGRGFPRLSWDVTFEDLEVRTDDGDPVQLSTDRVSFAGGDVTDPLTRERLLVEGEPAFLPAHREEVSVMLRGYTSASESPHPFGPCVRHDDEAIVVDLAEQGCDDAHANSYLPLTGIQCERPPVPMDVSYEIEADGWFTMEDVEVDDRMARGAPRRMEPTLMKVPDAGREIARPLEFVGVEMVNASCEELPNQYRAVCAERKDLVDRTGELEQPRAEWLWRWFVPSLDEDGRPIDAEVDPKQTRWEENWTPDVRVSEIGVFRALGLDRDGNPVVEDLSPARIHLDRQQLSSRSIECESDLSGDQPGVCTRFFPESEALLVTPGYDIGRLGVGERGTPVPKLEWIAEFSVYPDAAGFYTLPEVLPGEDVFIRFDLAGACEACLTARLQPTARDLGEQSLSKQSAFERVFHVQNAGLTPLWIDAMRLGGASGAHFELASSDGSSLPLRLDPGETWPLDLFFKSDQYGVHTATVEVDVRQGGTPQTLEAPVVVRAVDAIPNVLPERLDLWDTDCPEVWQGWSEKTALIESVGHRDLEIHSITLEGRDASSFAVARLDRGQLVPIRDESVAPGEAAEYRLFYFAPNPGSPDVERRARLRFETNGGAATIDLHGHACPYGSGW